MKVWKLEFITGTGIIAFAIFVLASSVGFPAAKGTDLGPSLVPRVIAVMLLVLGALVLFRGWRLRTGRTDCAAEAAGEELVTTAVGVRNLVVTIVAIVTYIIVVDNLGFIPTTVVFLFVLMKTYGLTTVRSIVFSCFIAGFVYVLFTMILRVVLP